MRYASHLVADFFNKLGLQLFYPLKWRLCLKRCRSDKKANRILFWVSLTVDIVLGAFLFSQAMIRVDHSANFITLISEKKLYGLNLLQLYLIFINVITFLGFERSQKAFEQKIWDAYENGKKYRDEDYETPAVRFLTGFLDLLVFLGGGIGMLLEKNNA